MAVRSLSFFFFFLINAAGGGRADASTSPWLPGPTQKDGTTAACPSPVTQAAMD